MKNWLSKHIYLLIFVILYALLALLASRFIVFDADLYRYGNHLDYDTIHHNIKVAVFYFISLPIAASLPVTAYTLIKHLQKKE